MSQDSNPLQDAMYDAAAGTLENMAFMEVIAVKERRDEQKFFSRLEIQTPVRGRLTLIATAKLAQEIAQGLGDPEDGAASEEAIRDMLAELINTIAGRLMAQLVPENETFSLSLPEAFTEGSVRFEEPYEIARFQIDGQTFLLAAEGKEFLDYKGA